MSLSSSGSKRVKHDGASFPERQVEKSTSIVGRQRLPRQHCVQSCFMTGTEEAMRRDAEEAEEDLRGACTAAQAGTE